MRLAVEPKLYEKGSEDMREIEYIVKMEGSVD